MFASICSICALWANLCCSRIDSYALCLSMDRWWSRFSRSSACKRLFCATELVQLRVICCDLSIVRDLSALPTMGQTLRLRMPFRWAREMRQGAGATTGRFIFLRKVCLIFFGNKQNHTNGCYDHRLAGPEQLRGPCDRVLGEAVRLEWESLCDRPSWAMFRQSLPCVCGDDRSRYTGPCDSGVVGPDELSLFDPPVYHCNCLCLHS